MLLGKTGSLVEETRLHNRLMMANYAKIVSGRLSAEEKVVESVQSLVGGEEEAAVHLRCQGHLIYTVTWTSNGRRIARVIRLFEACKFVDYASST
jgi:hypothetical protein